MDGLHVLRGGVLVAALLPCAAFAGGESGLYIGGGLGETSVEVDASDPTGGANFDFDGDDSGYKVILGYNIGLVPMFDLAVEGSYVDFGKVDGTSAGRAAELEINGFDAFGLVGFNFGPFGLFGKAGVIRWESDAVLASTATSDSGSGSAIGFGARIQLFSITLRGEYEMFDTDNTSDLSLFSVNALYTF